jgi:parvulin-like peptidyl-prolyl isomerase
VQYKRNAIRVLVAIVLLALAIAQPCAAQEWAPAGQGYAPMASPAPMSNEFTRTVVPGPPKQPSNASRPASWPGQAPAEATPWVPPAQRNAGVPLAQPVPAAGEIKPCDGTRIIARVGSEAIFESDAIGAVNEIIEANKNRIPADQVDKQREMLIQQRLKGLIETKLIFQDARRTIPEEGWKQVEKQIGTYFEENELDKMVKKSGVKTSQEFDQKLRGYGTSLDQEKRAFIERSLAQQWVHQQVKKDEEITYDQMVVFYREHLKEFTTPTRAQWEELMVRYSKYPTKVAAFEAIARMGNQVFGGAPLTEVAKTGSDGLTAANGGQWDWTSKGSLTNQQIDEALFNLPVGQLSPIIADEKGYHIIRVTKREEELVQPFLEAQVEIKKKIIEDRSRKQFREYMAELQRKTPVWTIYDGTDGTLHLANPEMPTRR